MLFTEAAMFLGPVDKAPTFFLWDPGADQLELLLCCSLFCLVIARGHDIDFDIHLSVLKNLQKGSCAEWSQVIIRIILLLPFDLDWAHAHQVSRKFRVIEGLYRLCYTVCLGAVVKSQ